MNTVNILLEYLLGKIHKFIRSFFALNFILSYRG